VDVLVERNQVIRNSGIPCSMAVAEVLEGAEFGRYPPKVEELGDPFYVTGAEAWVAVAEAGGLDGEL